MNVIEKDLKNIKIKKIIKTAQINRHLLSLQNKARYPNLVPLLQVKTVIEIITVVAKVLQPQATNKNITNNINQEKIKNQEVEIKIVTGGS